MRYIILFIAILFASISHAQNLNLNGTTIPVAELGTITIDSIGLTPDSVGYYRATVTQYKAKYISEIDTTIIDTVTVPISYVTGQQINTGLRNSIADALTSVMRSVANAYYADETISKLAPLNNVTVPLGYETLLNQYKALYNERHVGYWRLEYEANPARFFRINEDATIVEVEAGPNNTVVPVQGGLTGTVRYLGGNGIQIVNLVPGEAVVTLGTRVGDGNHIYVTQVGGGVKFTYLEEVFQRRTYNP